MAILVDTVPDDFSQVPCPGMCHQVTPGTAGTGSHRVLAACKEVETGHQGHRKISETSCA